MRRGLLSTKGLSTRSMYRLFMYLLFAGLCILHIYLKPNKKRQGTKPFVWQSQCWPQPKRAGARRVKQLSSSQLAERHSEPSANATRHQVDTNEEVHLRLPSPRSRASGSACCMTRQARHRAIMVRTTVRCPRMQRHGQGPS